VRFIVSRDKCEFVRRPLNIIDLLAITPYYVSVAMTALTGENPQLQRAGVTLRVLRMMRVFWLIKLARHFLGLQTLGLTLRRCYREMVMLLVFVCVAMAIFSALAQLLEHGLDLETSNEDYASIPAACWWVIISMTTVGYGDMYPQTWSGMLVGALCALAGVLTIAMPVPVIVNNFGMYYSLAMAKQKLPKKKNKHIPRAPQLGSPNYCKSTMNSPHHSPQSDHCAPAAQEEILEMSRAGRTLVF